MWNRCQFIPFHFLIVKQPAFLISMYHLSAFQLHLHDRLFFLQANTLELRIRQQKQTEVWPEAMEDVLYWIHAENDWSDSFWGYGADQRSWRTDFRRYQKHAECDVPYTGKTLMEKLGLKSKEGFRRNDLHPAIQMNLIRMTVPDKPNSRNQRYIRT